MTNQDKQPDPIDVHIGLRVRHRRRELGLSQEALASRLGITFQQIQKYERGANRISMSKFVRIAEGLNTPITYFFEGLDELADEDAVDPGNKSRHDFLTTPLGLELADAFVRVKPNHRRPLLNLVHAMAVPAQGFRDAAE